MAESAQVSQQAETTQEPQSKSEFADYSKSRMMALNARPVTPQAWSLVTGVADRLLRWEGEQKSRRYQRGAGKLNEYHRSVGFILGDLALAADRDSLRWSFRQMSRESFSRELVSYRRFQTIFKALRGIGFIEVRPGHYRRDDPVWRFGRSTRIRATAQLISLVREHGIAEGCARNHFVKGLPTRPLVLKGTSKKLRGTKVSGRTLGFDYCDVSRRLEAQVREINHFIDAHEIQGGTHRGYRRIFNCWDQEPYRWNKGGRLYSQGDDHYQLLKRPDRLCMTIDGEGVVEIDVRASYLTILHALRGEPLTGADPYIIGELPREVAKAWVTMTLGHDRFHSRWPRKTAEDLRTKGFDLRHYRVRDVQEQITAALPILTDWPDVEIDCFDLMYLESAAVVGTMVRLMREHEVVCLSVHDSIIVAQSRCDLAAQVLSTEYQGVVGVAPRLRVHPEGAAVTQERPLARVGDPSLPQAKTHRGVAKRRLGPCGY